MNQWLLLGGALLLGIVIGAVISMVLARRGRGDEASIRRLRRDFEDYRKDVSTHFVETAELVNRLTNSYREVYEHLEKGAYRLVGEEELQKQLSNVRAEPVMLEYIGQRRTPPEPRPETTDQASAERPAPAGATQPANEPSPGEARAANLADAEGAAPGGDAAGEEATATPPTNERTT